MDWNKFLYGDKSIKVKDGHFKSEKIPIVDWPKWAGKPYTNSQDGSWMIDQDLVDKHDPGFTYMFSIRNRRLDGLVREMKHER